MLPIGAALILVSGVAMWLSASTADVAEQEKAAAAVVAPRGPLHPVHIRQPDGPPRVVTDQLDTQGRPVTVACSTCHATKQPDVTTALTSDLDQFHQGLTMNHGGLTCVSCHNPRDYDTLRRADGRSVSYPDVMQLCAQCHGPQYRDYQRGSHGGMRGYWDRTRGPRYRNNCVDCHNAHAPQYQKVLPVFPPRDRNPAQGNEHAHPEPRHD